MEKDGTRDAAIASNTRDRSSAISDEQLAKFRELQRRRLQIQRKTRNTRKAKDEKEKIESEDVDTEGFVDEHNGEELKDSSVNTSSKGEDSNQVCSSNSRVDVHPALKKRKLHWGLDAKQRWERKANM